VLLACRRRDACASVCKELLRQAPGCGTVECIDLDLEDLASIRRFADTLKNRNVRIRTLVNNAGVMGVKPVHRHFDINHFGTFALTRYLMPLMAPHGRIVTVGSEAHRRATIQFDENGCFFDRHDFHAGEWWYRAYASSKLANVLMTAELQKRLVARKSSVTAVCVSPGRVATNIFNGVQGWLRHPLKMLAAIAFQTPAQGASGVLAATALKATPMPLYLHKNEVAMPSAMARDPKLAAVLWDASNRVIGIPPEADDTLWPES
jgi:NAD(P)-dependent dehydrogenase (short-subunit alcohol dehydrogenase family)